MWILFSFAQKIDFSTIYLGCKRFKRMQKLITYTRQWNLYKSTTMPMWRNVLYFLHSLFQVIKYEAQYCTGLPKKSRKFFLSNLGIDFLSQTENLHFKMEILWIYKTTWIKNLETSIAKLLSETIQFVGSTRFLWKGQLVCVVKNTPSHCLAS